MSIKLLAFPEKEKQIEGIEKYGSPYFYRRSLTLDVTKSTIETKGGKMKQINYVAPKWKAEIVSRQLAGHEFEQAKALINKMLLFAENFICPAPVFNPEVADYKPKDLQPQTATLETTSLLGGEYFTSFIDDLPKLHQVISIEDTTDTDIKKITFTPSLPFAFKNQKETKNFSFLKPFVLMKIDPNSLNVQSGNGGLGTISFEGTST